MNKDEFPLGMKIAAAVVAALGSITGLLILLGIFILPLSFITMILLGILHAEVALGIPAFGYWASFWITVSLSYFGTFFRSKSK